MLINLCSAILPVVYNIYYETKLRVRITIHSGVYFRGKLYLHKYYLHVNKIYKNQQN